MKSFTSLLKRPLRSCKTLSDRIALHIHRYAVKRLILARFTPPETIFPALFREYSPISDAFVDAALASTFNASRTSSAAIINNYCQGAVLFGDSNSDKMTWVLPSHRAVILPSNAHLPRRLRDYMKRGEFTVRYNSDFRATVARSKRPEWTWITPPIEQYYNELFDMGFAWSIEAYNESEMVGGMWGLMIGGTSAIMSLFHQVDSAGSIVMGTLVGHVMRGEIAVCDCGTMKPHFERYGAQAMSRSEFADTVALHLHKPRPEFLCVRRPPETVDPLASSDSATVIQ